MLFLGILGTGTIKVNHGHIRAQGRETITLVPLACVYMAWERFLRHPTNLPADKNPQVNNQGFVEEDDNVVGRDWPVQIIGAFFFQD